MTTEIRPNLDLKVRVKLGPEDVFRLPTGKETYEVWSFTLSLDPDLHFIGVQHIRGGLVRKDGSVGQQERNVYGLYIDNMPEGLLRRAEQAARDEIRRAAATPWSVGTRDIEQ